jgi:hypothetical protein
MLVPDKTNPLFCDHSAGDAKTTGTPITKRNDKAIKAKIAN